MYNGLQMQWNRRFATVSASASPTRFRRARTAASNYRDIVPDTYNASNLWGPSEFDTRHVVVFNYVYDLPFFKDRQQAVREAAGRLADQRRRTSSRPERPAASAVNNDYAGVGEVGSFGCGSEGQFWIMNGTPTIMGQFANSAASPNQYFATTNSSGAPIFTRAADGNVQSAEGRSRLHLPARLPGLESRVVQEVRDQRKDTASSFAPRRSTSTTIRTGAVASFNPTSSTSAR